MKGLFNTEVFYEGKFVQWMCANSLSDLIQLIAKYERVDKLNDLKLSYLVFQENPEGRWKGTCGKWHLACRINCRGDEKPKFFELR